jgi:hypothetical protein
MKYIPGFAFDPRDDKIIRNFNTINELLSIDFVKSWKKHRNFYRFSLANEHLMAEFKNGDEWYIIGTIYTDDDILSLKNELIELPKPRFLET